MQWTSREDTVETSTIRELTGLLAATLTTIAFIPQALKVWKAKPHPAKDVSRLTFWLLTFGFAIWLAYGIWLKSLAVALSNAIALPFAIAVVIYKEKNG